MNKNNTPTVKEFLNNIPIFLIKGFILFLGFGLLIEFIDNEFMNKLISSSSWGIKFLFLLSVGLVAHYTFWKTFDKNYFNINIFSSFIGSLRKNNKSFRVYNYYWSILCNRVISCGSSWISTYFF